MFECLASGQDDRYCLPRVQHNGDSGSLPLAP
jgi:hypothetical protein